MNEPSLTVTYSRTHDAIATVAAQHDTTPRVARVLVALLDRGGSATSHELADDLYAGGSFIRHALINDIYPRRWALGEADGGGRRRPGCVSRITLTAPGRAIADEVLALLETVELDDAPAEAIAA